jgi:hypothetical protein
MRRLYCEEGMPLAGWILVSYVGRLQPPASLHGSIISEGEEFAEIAFACWLMHYSAFVDMFGSSHVCVVQFTSYLTRVGITQATVIEWGKVITADFKHRLHVSVQDDGTKVAGVVEALRSLEAKIHSVEVTLCSHVCI